MPHFLIESVYSPYSLILTHWANLSVNMSGQPNIVEGVSFEHCDVDDLWISIKLENNECFLICNVYRHPSSAIDTFKTIFLNFLDLLN